MNWPRLKSRVGRTVVVLGLAGGMLGGFGAAAAQAAGVGSEPGDVSLNPASGSTSLTPTWSTTVGCNTGYQGSAVFRIIEPDGTTASISPVVNAPTSAFSGTLLDDLNIIQTDLPPGIPNGGTAEFVVFCYAGGGLQGASDPEMSTFVTFSADGSSYTSSNVQVPIGEIGGLVFAGLAAIGLVYMQVRRRRRRTQPAAA